MNRFKKQLIEDIREEKEVLKIPFLNYGNLIVIASLKVDEYALYSIKKEEVKLYERRLGRKPMSRYQKHRAYRYMPRREAKKEMINDHAKKSRKYSMVEYVVQLFNQQDKKNRIYSDEELAYIRSLRQNFELAVADALYEMEL